jgi:hypothetical protein
MCADNKDRNRKLWGAEKVSHLVSFYIYLPLVFALNIGFRDLYSSESESNECHRYL